MKPGRSAIFIILFSAALLSVLAIQVHWILQAADAKEALFNERANMVLTRASEALSADKETCRKIGECMDSSTGAQAPGRAEMHKIDSILSYYMRLYGFHIAYTFKVLKPTAAASAGQGGFIRYFADPQTLAPHKDIRQLAHENGFELNLQFPGKDRYILAETGPVFIVSVLLIMALLILYWRTVTLLGRQKKVAAHTRDLLNNMAHEFKTPLTNIALAGRMIHKDDAVKNSRAGRYADVILQENERLTTQVEQVLHMAALEQDEIPLHKAPLDVNELVKEMAQNFAAQAEAAGGHIMLKLCNEPAEIRADKRLLANALANLADNAVKYAGTQPDITAETSAGEGNILITIADKGIGIPHEYHKKVFEKFFRVPAGDVHNVKGFGMGLAYVKKIVAMHGGTIDVQSAAGKGTVFTIKLPHG